MCKCLRTMGSITGLVVLLFGLSVIGAVGQERINVEVEAAVPQTEFIYKHLPEFEDKTGIEVNIIEVPNALQREKVMADAMATGPSQFDVVYLFACNFTATFSSIGYLEPMEKYFTEAEIKELDPTAVESCSWKETMYLWPWCVHNVGNLYYRTDLFEEYGLEPPKTWDEWLLVGKKLTFDTDGDGEIDIWGTLLPAKKHPEPQWRIIARVLQAGGRVWDENGNCVLDAPEAIAGLEFTLTELKSGMMPPEMINMTCVEGHTLFLQGRLAMFENWAYMYKLAQNPAHSKVVDKFDVTPGIGKVKRTWVLNPFAWGIPKRSEHKEAALKFIKWVTSDEMLIKKALWDDVLPCIPRLMNSPELKEHKEIAAFAQSNAMATPSPGSVSLNWGEVMDIFMDYWHEALLENMTPQEAWKRAAKEINEVVASK